MMYNFLRAGVISFIYSVALLSSAHANPAAETTQSVAQRDPQLPSQRRDPAPLLEETGLERVDSTRAENPPVRFSVRLSSELFTNSGDLHEFQLPVRYSPSERLALEAVPVIKYFPESNAEEFDYGIKFAVEYQL